MPSPNLSESVDTDNADDPGDPSVEQHQEDHDVIHRVVNVLDTDLADSPSDGDVPVFRTASGTFVPEAAAGVPGPQGAPGADGDDGVGFIFTGPWDSGTTYHVFSDNTPEAYEVAEFLGSSYVALTTHSNSPPPLPANAPSTDWALYAAKGDQGDAGVDGSDGVSITGPAGPPGPSRENLSPSTSLDGSETMDLGAATGYVRTLDGNSTLHFVDTSGATFSAATIRLTMGSGGPYTITWPDLDSGTWVSTNDAVAGEPPDLSGMSAGDEITIVVEQMASVWRGYVPGGAGGGGVVTPPPDTFPTLAMAHLMRDASRAQKTIPTTGADVSWPNLGGPTEGAVQVRPSSGVFAFVGVTGLGGIDPPEPTSLVGGGVSTWVKVVSQTDEDTGATIRRRLTLFYAREVNPGAAATFTVNQPGAVGQVFNSCSIKVVQTSVDVPGASFEALVMLSARGRSHNSGAGGDELPTTMHCPMDAFADAANRPIVGVMTNLTPNTSPTIVPLGGFTELAPAASINNPSNNLWSIWDPSDDDNAPSATFTEAAVAVGAQWISVGCEMEQG